MNLLLLQSHGLPWMLDVYLLFAFVLTGGIVRGGGGDI